LCVPRLRSETYVSTPGAIERRNAGYLGCRVTPELTTNDVCNGKSGESASTLTAG
jgi:hypothetical protein